MKNYLNQCAKFLLGFMLFSLVVFSCKKDEVTGEYSNGVFIVNEGSFGNNNGSVSFYSYNTDSVYNNIFYQVNGRTLGDVIQSITIHNDKAYILVNNSNKVEIADKNTFEEMGVITGLISPRHLVVHDDLAYVSCWGDNSINVIDLRDNSITETILVGTGPDKMCITNNKLYIANTGGWSTDSTISVIDLETNEVIKIISAKYSPYDLVVDIENNIWALCFGKVVYDIVDPYPIIEETPSKLYKIDTETDELAVEVELFANQHPWHLEISNEGDLFLGGGYAFEGIYRIDIESNPITLTQVITDFAYGLNYDPNSDILFVTLSPSFTEPGTLKRYGTDGLLLGTYTCSLGPSGIAFKNAYRE